MGEGTVAATRAAAAVAAAAGGAVEPGAGREVEEGEAALVAAAGPAVADPPGREGSRESRHDAGRASVVSSGACLTFPPNPSPRNPPSG